MSNIIITRLFAAWCCSYTQDNKEGTCQRKYAGMSISTKVLVSLSDSSSKMTTFEMGLPYIGLQGDSLSAGCLVVKPI